jgi:hypothetical protein
MSGSCSPAAARALAGFALAACGAALLLLRAVEAGRSGDQSFDTFAYR